MIPRPPPAARASVMSAAMGRVRAAMQARTAGRTGARAGRPAASAPPANNAEAFARAKRS